MKSILINISFIFLILFNMNEIGAQVPEQENADGKVLIYPNPTAGPLHIDFISESRVKPTAKILDITGKQVDVFTGDLVYSNGKFVADITVDELKPGIYFIKIEQLNEVELKKVVVR